MNVSEIVELEVALKQLLVYNLGVKDLSWPGNRKDTKSVAFKLATHDYQGVLNDGKELISSLNPETEALLVENLQFTLQNSPIER
jgi:hypothetical protein